MAPVRPSDEELLCAGPEASVEALTEFYCRYERPVFAYFVRREQDADVAADLTGQVFLHVVEGRSRFNPSRGDAAAWLFGIARHVFAEHQRRGRAEKRRHRQLLRDLHTMSDKALAEIERLTEDGPLVAALAHLPEAQRDAVTAYVIADRSYEDIAENASINPAAARKRVSRGLAALAAIRSSRREDR